MDMHAPIFECSIARLVVKYRLPKNTCHNEIGLYSQIVDTVSSTMVIRIRRVYVIAQHEKTFSTLMSYNLCISISL